ncbi:hypothetical protein ACIBL8_30400 [Streptomyces sp. NPDC050523]|uniref:hypothetical protein n=1 Tax=Streptomyces sp. NPDC050523 TaxID=3365622 RepID=UPI0037903C69
MHRSTTTATLLVTVAVSALTGCVTVPRAPAPGPPPAPPRPSAPHPDGAAGPRIVQAPAREALEMIGPSRSAAPTAPTARARHEEPPATASAQRPPTPHPPRQPSRPRAAHPPAEGRRQPHVELPDLRGNTDVCALGRQYGGWQEGSPEAVICEQAYGS